MCSWLSSLVNINLLAQITCNTPSSPSRSATPRRVTAWKTSSGTPSWIRFVLPVVCLFNFKLAWILSTSTGCWQRRPLRRDIKCSAIVWGFPRHSFLALHRDFSPWQCVIHSWCVAHQCRFKNFAIRFCYVVPVPSPRGALVGLAPEQNSKTPQTEIWNAISKWNFCQISMSSPPPCTNVKPPYWRLSGDGSVSSL